MPERRLGAPPVPALPIPWSICLRSTLGFDAPPVGRLQIAPRHLQVVVRPDIHPELRTVHNLRLHARRLAFFDAPRFDFAAGRAGRFADLRRAVLLGFACFLSPSGLMRRSAIAVSLWSVAFSSARFAFKCGMTPGNPSSFAQAMSAP